MRCVRGQNAMEVVGAGMVDLCDYEVVRGRDIAPLGKRVDREDVAFRVVAEEAGVGGTDVWWGRR